jgi:hypothetical protein
MRHFGDKTGPLPYRFRRPYGSDKNHVGSLEAAAISSLLSSAARWPFSDSRPLLCRG